MSHFADFVFQQDVQQIFRYFTRLLGIRIVFFSYDGRELTVGDDRDLCRYCHILRCELGYEETCHALDLAKQQEAAQRRQMVSYCCHGGMMEAVMPVYHVDRLLGFVMIGQFRMTDELPEQVRERWNQAQLAEGADSTFRQTPYYSQERLDDILGLFPILVQFIIDHRLIRIRSQDALSTLIDFIEQHPEQTLTLNEAAQLVYRSPSSLAHLFKELTGQGFRQFQINRKLDRAEQWMAEYPEMSIAQIARKLGYADALYFSKLYKKYRGRAATAFRAEARKQR